ncbi:hypothetical protein JIN85_06960 [Luteolibacter pohnpeiensis]|uniref:Uncharacterized protein n=1 Tax=Luteolibacter pohnpeiensis TaxID=454153 RepID=A0A934S456_9BACT|nr:hypothetical protein [Luteolibacter pohnpeiensis]MBK1882146.1 hypothetical protein [Luteolibacter pohnpeiensis]
MSIDIPEDVMEKILELRKKNGLVPTPEAVIEDITTAKTKFTLKETPRYRRAGDSPLYIAGKYLTSHRGVCPATGERETPRSESVATPVSTSKEQVISEDAFVKVLAGKGFKFTRLVNTITGEVVKEESDPKIARLNLAYQQIPNNADHTKVYVQRTTPQIQVAMTLDRFLELAGIKG